MEPTVLVVDDQPENVRVLAELLRPHYRVLVATDGPRALALAAAEPPPDLMLLDVTMPAMDGFEVMRRLREQPATRELPVIFLTARDSVADEQRGLAMGAVDYVTKPVVPPTVMARVQTQVALKRARDRLAGHNRSLEAEIAERLRDNEAIQDVGILALARLAETRDPETGNHIRRTQAYVRRLAERMASHPRYRDQLDPRSIDLLAKSAPLHDIGKVGIPDAILLKPGKLDAAEWAVMRTHAALGARAIELAEAGGSRPVPFLRFAREIAQSHHERWDGTGYPDGLRGEDIPLSARLMAIADVFDALISRRVYKPPYPADRARELMVAERGKHFDPTLLDAFLEEFDAYVAVARELEDPEEAVRAHAARLGMAAAA